MTNFEDLRPTESEYYARVWSQKYDELRRMGSFTPVASATLEADEHMRRLTMLGNVPWKGRLTLFDKW